MDRHAPDYPAYRELHTHFPQATGSEPAESGDRVYCHDFDTKYMLKNPTNLDKNCRLFLREPSLQYFKEVALSLHRIGLANNHIPKMNNSKKVEKPILY
jgi:hypothetical protein